MEIRSPLVMPLLSVGFLTVGARLEAIRRKDGERVKWDWAYTVCAGPFQKTGGSAKE